MLRARAAELEHDGTLHRCLLNCRASRVIGMPYGRPVDPTCGWTQQRELHCGDGGERTALEASEEPVDVARRWGAAVWKRPQGSLLEWDERQHVHKQPGPGVVLYDLPAGRDFGALLIHV